MLRYTHPARHPSLILVEALDLGQVCGWGVLHLETLLVKKDSQRSSSSVALVEDTQQQLWANFTGKWKHIYQCKAIMVVLVNTTNRPASMLTPVVGTTGTVW